MPYKKIYDFKKVDINIGIDSDAFALVGIVSVSAARNEDAFTTNVAATGSWRNTRTNNNSGTITIVLSAHSSSLQSIMLLDKLGVQFPIAVIDKTSDGAAVFGDGCILSKPPDFERGLEEGEVEFVFTCGDLQINHAGAADVS
jgi:hypothetical protein